MTFVGVHDGKIALVLGGSRGIGAAIVEQLALDGAKVTFTYAASQERAERLASRLTYESCEAYALRADSAQVAEVEAAIDQVVERFGRLDILVVNAGILIPGRIDAMTIEDFDQILAINVRGVFAALRHAAKRMPDGARIMTIGSNIANRVGFPGASAYAMSKAAVAALVKGVAIDLAPRAITVNNIQPGPMRTEMTQGSDDFILPTIPLGRMGQTPEVAGLVSYLAGRQAAFVTGASMTIDGGASL